MKRQPRGECFLSAMSSLVLLTEEDNVPAIVEEVLRQEIGSEKEGLKKKEKEKESGEEKGKKMSD